MDINNGETTNKSYHIRPYGNPSSVRKMPITNSLMNILLEYKRHREREQRHQDKYSYMGNDDLVFGNEKSELRSYSGISHLLRKFLKRRGLENITFTNLRQTWRNIMTETEKTAKAEKKLSGAEKASQKIKKKEIEM